MNKLAKHADTLKIESGDLRNNVFTAKIALDELKKNIEGICFKTIIVPIITLRHKYDGSNMIFEL